MTTPPPLHPGDRIAIVSPAGIINPRLAWGAMRVLAAQGWDVRAGAHAWDRHGTYAGTLDARLADLEEALLDEQVKAVVCSRGGYGAVQLLDRLDRLPLEESPKWLVGFSDITALHALMGRHGIESIHGPMLRHIARLDRPQGDGGDDGGEPDCSRDISMLFELLRGHRAPVLWPGHRLNRPGTCTGVLRGGNLAVASGLVSTPFDTLRPGSVLLIEDIAEPVYKVERMLYTLRLGGVLESLGGLIAGRFTRYEQDANAETMEEMIARLTAPYGYPVALGVPVGHSGLNTPLVLGAKVRLTVDREQVKLEYTTPG